MSTLRIMHAADLHLGAKITGLGAQSAARSAEIMHTFFRMLALCQQEKTQLLLLAGDFLELSAITSEQVRAVMDGIASMSDLQVVLAPGNHDYLSPDSPYALTWPSNMHIFTGEMTRLDFPQWNTAVYGAAFTGTYQPTSLVRADWEKERLETADRLRLLVIHGDWNAPKSLYHPLLAEDFPPEFFTYIAMGHVHKRSPLMTLGKTTLAYSGCPDASGFDETGLKGVYLGEVSPFSCDLSFYPLSSRLFRHAEVDCTGIVTTSEAEKHILETLTKTAQGFAPSDTALRLTLTGALADRDAVDVGLLEEMLREQLYVLSLRDERQVAVNWDVLRKEESLKGYYVEALYARRKEASEEEKRIIDRALRLGLDAFDGKELRIAHFTD